ncbi:MAG TPA: cytochrome c biogenesis protein CcsA [Haliangiales bacterium]|nr:cytochrome c biogenesis protein CcsA [Haliangiales bacterium]
MNGLPGRSYFLAAVVVYGLSAIYSVFLWRKGFRQDDRVNYGVLLLAAIFHTAAMFQRGFSFDRCPVNNLYEATTFVLWTIVATYLVVGLWPRFRFLGAFAAPLLLCAGVFALMPGLDNSYGSSPEIKHDWVSLHAALILLSYGAFGLSSVAGLMYLTQEHDLKFHKMRAIFSVLPPIQRLELAIRRLMASGFVLLTGGLAIGAVWLKLPEGINYLDDPKVHWSILVWLLYLTLLIMNWRFAQGGRRFAWGAVGCFLFVLLTFWGVNLMSPIHH